VERAGGRLSGFAFVVELLALEGRRKLPQAVPVEALIRYA
jgi:adenine/guanine phosphoribosyltransferase-like PRPP-binding protein